jgi:hypothetical protein
VADASSWFNYFFFLTAFLAGLFAAFFVAMSTPPPFDLKNGDWVMCDIADFAV